ncbi:DUF3050 domain-containing protein [Rhodoferax sp. 4810]|uniref:DUF3050 domain-containing protein n=2 Tax=Thiospirillum jenense TaxID=1653858 RepID=A0A839HNB7_9GAMM|nr:DUF3050 domain-containing protein [Thiospirillum jenense]MBB1075798.1 DUF3050 domain-containing protein [Rhodoferax jenense]MBB1126872.1 DUF3050 domain-containing protein [Thiospirillum jenense]
MTTDYFADIQPLRDELNCHPLYAALQDEHDLKVFMTHHVFSVWDFMSLVKYLQQQLAPSQYPWQPRGKAAIRFFINQLVLEEESDSIDLGDGHGIRYGSHFEFYCDAMREVGADGDMPIQFLNQVRDRGLELALKNDMVPPPSRQFMQTTFKFIQSNQPHCVAAALAFGREQVIPGMFRQFLSAMGITPTQAPIFHSYLNRHIYLDEDFHGPLSLQLLAHFCKDDAQRYSEAAAAAATAIRARLQFWDGVLAAIERQRGRRVTA